MESLSDRIADVRRKAVGLADVEEIARLPNREWYERKAAYVSSASPDLIIQMADRIEELEKALVDCAASLSAVCSLLKRGGKKAAPSDKMFEQMLVDYEASLSRTVRVLNGEKP